MTLIPIYKGTISHAAGYNYWSQLYSNLTGQTGSRAVYLNELGQDVTIPVDSLAKAIYNGAVWVDWCGWPFYSISPNAFNDLLQYMGYNMSGVQFTKLNLVPTGASEYFGNVSKSFFREIVYPRYFSSTESIPTQWIINKLTPYGVGETSLLDSGFFDTTHYFATSFAIPYGKGAYIYAYGDDGQRFGNFELTPPYNGVSPSIYASFILEVLGRLPKPNGAAQYLPSLPHPTTSDFNPGGGTVTSPVTIPQVSNPSSSPPSCTQYGTYLGTGEAVDVEQGYYLFRKLQYPTDSEYTDYVVTSGCAVVSTYVHPMSALSTSSRGASSSNSKSYANGQDGLLIVALGGLAGLLFAITYFGNKGRK